MNKKAKKTKKEKKEEEETYFANARVVRLIRQKTGKKILKSRVKEGMNKLLEDICLKISERMAEMPYATINYGDFVKAAAPYLKLGLSQQERKKIIATLNKISEDSKMLSMELEEELRED